MLTLNSEYYEILNNEKLLVNNELILGYSLLLPRIKNRINSLYDIDHFCIMHGICFNNILFEFFIYDKTYRSNHSVSHNMIKNIIMQNYHILQFIFMTIYWQVDTNLK